MLRWFAYFHFVFNSLVSAPPPSILINHPDRFSFEKNSTHTNEQISPSRVSIISHTFDINSYRSSWKFIDKDTIRVRFHLNEIFYQSNFFPRFLVRHLHTGQIRIYNESHELINSTLTIYLHNLKRGRHIICLYLYRKQLITKPRHIFCQDLINNFRKYGHLDIDTDEHGNTVFFLMTQYSIVISLLCLLQLAHSIRKRRFWNYVYEKLNMWRNVSGENSSSPKTQQHSRTLEYLIYNFNRNALVNWNNTYNQEPNRTQFLEVPNLRKRHSVFQDDNNDDDYEEDFHPGPSAEEESLSYQFVSHILEESKPWIVKLNEDGTTQHQVYRTQARV